MAEKNSGKNPLAYFVVALMTKKEFAILVVVLTLSQTRI
jgi:hypothetical protein